MKEVWILIGTNDGHFFLGIPFSTKNAIKQYIINFVAKEDGYTERIQWGPDSEFVLTARYYGYFFTATSKEVL